MGSIDKSTAADVAKHIEPGSFPLDFANFPNLDTSECKNPSEVATAFVDAFNKVAGGSDVSAITELFHPDSFWRDQLCLSWDFHTLQGPKKIATLLEQSKGEVRVKSIKLDTSSALRSPRPSMVGPLHTVSAFLTIETDVGNGGGVVNLIQDQGVWKVFTLFTYLKELKGHEELTGARRPNGYEGHETSRNWLDDRDAERKLENGGPTVLILGKVTPLSLITLSNTSKALVKPDWESPPDSVLLESDLLSLTVRSVLVTIGAAVIITWFYTMRYGLIICLICHSRPHGRRIHLRIRWLAGLSFTSRCWS